MSTLLPFGTAKRGTAGSGTGDEGSDRFVVVAGRLLSPKLADYAVAEAPVRLRMRTRAAKHMSPPGRWEPPSGSGFSRQSRPWRAVARSVHPLGVASMPKRLEGHQGT